MHKVICFIFNKYSESAIQKFWGKRGKFKQIFFCIKNASYNIIFYIKNMFNRTFPFFPHHYFSIPIHNIYIKLHSRILSKRKLIAVQFFTISSLDSEDGEIYKRKRVYKFISLKLKFCVIWDKGTNKMKLHRIYGRVFSASKPTP